MLINYGNEMLHNSSLDIFRDPVGAMPTDTAVVMRFRTRLENVNSVYLTVYNDRIRLNHQMRIEDGYWRADITAPEHADVYWYFFAVNVDGKIFYYGAEGNRHSGIGCVYSDTPPPFQLTVYKADFETPEWFQKTIMYQIFPDRFCRSSDDTVQKGIAYHKSKKRNACLHEKWEEEPWYLPRQGESAYNPCDYFGGTLKGIEDSLEYIKSLGVGVIYINPIFEAASNHRYNTADYLKIDPVLGSDADFKSLCKKADGMGIRIMLDGVFSHTGSDSRYFNREKAYKEPGAANSKQSPYYPWYVFENYPDKYKCWWGFESLPEVNEYDPGWQQFIITGKDSVIRHWLNAGAAGYRLDVADELPDDILEMMYQTVRAADPEAVMLGEVWEDATTKHSYGERRSYSLGGKLDSVTNYPFRTALITFLSGRTTSADLKGFLVEQATNYPKPLYYALTNLLSSHDVERVRTALSTRIDPKGLSRAQQATFVISDNQNKKGAQRQNLAAALQYSMPGVPCLYYGDEKGMNGFLDPFNRATFRDAQYDMTEAYCRYAQLRLSADALKAGHAVFYAPDPDCIGILRFVTDGKDVFGREAQNGAYLIAVNRSEKTLRVVFDLAARNDLFSESQQKSMRRSLEGRITCMLSRKEYKMKDALLDLTIHGMGVVWLKII